ncbi:hypothetical protein SAMN04489761_0078 [Tenacibaculum sp. MAR_2009_124]|uniref:hypothetical protein n=1 Tax=Tenacibaculum sp. MAR_2009_124 TaxID=1250059 RepID=UPI0008954BB3|nr:hypothetical protein [Tenacibaculum sp. MAR_2009_124]SEB35637.1 hypothetical protein SAMN04489761_0078 [Tenacibaculum sp. MAR_2009_124]
MKNLNLFLLVISFISLNTFAQQQTLQEFKKECDASDLQFKMPKGFKRIDTKENGDLYYSYAIINEDASMEVRYTIWSLEPALEEYKKTLKDENAMMIPVNNIYKGRVQTNVLNMTGGVMYSIGAFHPKAVKKEFHADAGGSCFLEFNSEFGKGYTYGQFIYLHKDDVADVIVTFMSNDKSKHSDLMMQAFYALTFKE